MIRAIVFDIDGVLVKPMVFASVLLREYGLGLDRTALFFEGPFRKCLLGEADLKTELLPYLPEWGWPHTLDQFVQEWFDADSTMNEEMVGFVRNMRRRNLPCYIASTQEQYRAGYLMNNKEFSEHFNGFFFSYMFGCQKPQAQFYSLVEKGIGVAPNELLFFDDQELNVIAARKAGWNAEIYTFGADLSGIVSCHSLDRDA
jgi:putative hydrolase of the HAD superfamily